MRPRTHRCIGGINCLWSVAIPNQKACSVHGRRPLVAIKSRISWCCRPSTSRGPGLRDHLPSAESAASNWSCAGEECVCVVYLSSSRTRTQEPGEGVVNQRTFCLLIVGVVIQRYADFPQWHAAATCGSCKKRSASGDSFWGRTATALLSFSCRFWRQVDDLNSKVHATGFFFGIAGAACEEKILAMDGGIATDVLCLRSCPTCELHHIPS